MADDRIVVIGAGSAGTRAARALARAGRRVVVTDAGVYGGTCLWDGCVPKKALFTAGAVHRETLGAGWLGLHAAEDLDGGRPFDWPRIRAWQQGVMEAYAGDQEETLQGDGVETLHGAARFVAADTVEIDGERYGADQIVVAAGSRPVLPPIPGAELLDTTDEALFYDELPRSLIVIGGGYIAMEMAGIYAAFGVAVSLMVRGSEVLKQFDPECAQVALEGLQALNVRVHPETEVLEVSGERGGLRLTVAGEVGGDRELVAERVLAATGRRPQLEALEVHAGEIELDERGRPLLDEHLRSRSNPRVWLAGDAAGGPQFTPVASFEGSEVARPILGEDAETLAGTTFPTTCFTFPEVARVGLSEAELAARGEPYQVARGPMTGTAQAIMTNTRLGVVKLLGDEQGRLLGVHLAGPQAVELIYGLAIALRAGATIADVRSTRAVHPSLSEAVNWAAFSPETMRP